MVNHQGFATCLYFQALIQWRNIDFFSIHFMRTGHPLAHLIGQSLGSRGLALTRSLLGAHSRWPCCPAKPKNRQAQDLHPS
jgi:hypothetical protein